MQAVNTPVAQADTAPAAGTPTTVGADALPTAQINGVVWSQEIAGTRVYVGGNFTKARPAGTALGSSSEVPRTMLMSYNLVTGEMDSTFAPVLNGQVKDMALSPDKSVLYVSGQFTTINGLNRYRVAAFDAVTGALLPFQPSVNATVSGIAVSSDRVYIGGSFTTVNGTLRDGAAAIPIASPLTVTAFNPILGGGDPQTLAVSPDGAKVVLGGNFTTVNGSSNPGYGLAMVAADTGASLPTSVNGIVRDANLNASITSLVGTADGFYGSGYTYSRTDGNLEGIFRADWNGNLVFLEDCHGDTYDLYPDADVVYSAGHTHYCGNVGGFLQPTNWVFWRGLAWSNSVRGTVGREHLGYYNFEGQPRPDMLQFFPDINIGTFTGQSQGPWEVTGSGDYVVYGGEFTQVNGVGQQGLVRFVKPGVATSKMRPVLDYSTYQLSFIPLSDGQMRVYWPATWDRDNEQLTYQLYRDSVRVFQGQASSRFYQIPQLSFIDSGLVPGRAYGYQLRVVDPDGNVAWSAPSTYTYQTGAALNSYDDAVLQDNPTSYWRLNETSGSTAVDMVSGWNGTKGALASVGAAGAIFGSTDTAYSFNPTSSSTTSTVIPQTKVLASNYFSVEAWFKTTSTRGGAIVNFGGATSGNSTTDSMDRVVYVSNTGRVLFGVYPGERRSISTSAAYNDGKWHHVAASMGKDGMKLYLDGALAASNATWTNAHNTSAGVWRIGGDRMSSWPSNPSSGYLAGTIDQVAVYSVVLDPAQVSSHFVVGTTGTVPNQPPVAMMTAHATDLTVAVDSVGSSDPDGTIAGYSWNFGDGTAPVTTATASHPYAAAGTYTITLTVTDNRGGTAQATQQVSVVAPNQLPVAAFTTSVTDLTVGVDAGGSSDPDGAIAAYSWNFGDGSTATGPTATHAYATGGTRTITLTVTDDRGGTATATKSVTVVPPNQLPTASFSWSATALHVSFDASASTDPDGSLASYAWDFGDGATGTGSVTDHTYAAAGDFVVTLTVTDNRGGTATVSKTATASNHVNAKPVAAFTASDTGLKVSFNGSGSSDSDGTVAGYDWDFGDGERGTGATTSHTYAASGSYTVTLTVTDNEGASSDPATKALTLANAKPTAAFSSSTSGLNASVDGSGSTDPDGTIAAYAWDYGDGSNGTGASPSHTFSGTGSYAVKLTVTDDKGSTDSVTHLVTVGSGAIVADKFNRTVTRWGDADTGGTWTYANSSYYTTDGSVGKVKLPSAGASGTASLTSVSARDVNVFGQMSQDVAVTGSGTYNTFIVRRVGTTDYRMTTRISSDGTVRLNLTKRISGTATNLGDVLVSGVVVSPGDVLNMRFVATGNGSTSLEAKAWKAGTPEPATAPLRRTDTAVELQTAGDFAVTTYLGGTVTTLPVVVSLDNLLVTPA